MPVLEWFTDEIVNSETTTVQVKFKRLDVLQRVVAEMKGTLEMEEKEHTVWTRRFKGRAIRLPGWQHPIVWDGNQLIFDHYNGKWGNPKDIDTLMGKYVKAAAAAVADELSWTRQVNEDGTVTIYHPSGGVLTVSPSGIVDATGFVGNACHDAVGQITAALGDVTHQGLKCEANLQQNMQQNQ